MSLAAPSRAQQQYDAIETAANLEQMLDLLQARNAQPSTHLLLEAPDIAAPGTLRLRLRSELPGTALLVLARGRFSPQANPNAMNSAPPPLSTRRSIGEIQPKERLPRPVWLGTFPIAAGRPAEAKLSVDVDKSQTLSLFAHAQGRWWFVSRDIKLGQLR